MIRPSEWPSSSERKSNDRRTTKCAIRIASGVIGAARATMALEVGDKRAKQFVIRRMRRLAPRRSGNLLEKGANERGCQLRGLTNERNVRSFGLPSLLPSSIHMCEYEQRGDVSTAEP